MSDAELDAIDARLEAATPAGHPGEPLKWKRTERALQVCIVSDLTCAPVCTVRGNLGAEIVEGEAELIVNTPTDLRKLVAEVRLLRGLLGDAILDEGPRRELVLMGRRQMRKEAIAAMRNRLAWMGLPALGTHGLNMAIGIIEKMPDGGTNE
jgi:hypothetical protein